MPAAIFDLDGTLVDLFEVHLRGFQNVLSKRLGVSFEREDLEATYGKSGEEIIRVFLDRQGVEHHDIHSLAVERRQWVADNLGGCESLPGAVELMRELSERGFKLGLGTSNTESIGEKIIHAAGIASFFRAKAYKSSGVRGKPAPDIFLKVSELLMISPPECVVFEDSIHGILAASSAKMKSIGVATGVNNVSELDIAGADMVFESLKEVSGEDVIALIKAQDRSL
jgi:beta-phosphoglucomutase